MKIGKEKTVKYVNMEVTLTKEEEEKFLELGKKLILKDDNAIIEYAMRKSIEDICKKKEIKKGGRNVKD